MDQIFPTCALDVKSGDCGATYSCITSPNYPENYAPDGSCVNKLVSLLTLDVKDIKTEVLWDMMVMNSQNYSSSVVRLVLWVLRQMVRSLVFEMELAEKNWSMYADMTTPAPTLPPTLSPTSLIVVSDGECDVVGDRVIARISIRLWIKSGM